MSVFLSMQNNLSTFQNTNANNMQCVLRFWKLCIDIYTYFVKYWQLQLLIHIVKATVGKVLTNTLQSVGRLLTKCCPIIDNIVKATVGKILTKLCKVLAILKNCVIKIYRISKHWQIVCKYLANRYLKILS